MSLRFALLAVASTVAFASTAEAIIHGGNPHLDFFVTPPEGTLSGGDVDVDRIRVHNCGGGFTDYIVNETIDPVEGYGLDITGGNLCGVTVFWDSDMYLDGNNVSGDYTIRYDDDLTYVPLGNPTSAVPLAPFFVEDGIIHGGNPHLDLEINR